MCMDAKSPYSLLLQRTSIPVGKKISPIKAYKHMSPPTISVAFLKLPRGLLQTTRGTLVRKADVQNK
jgi:hypothetical protein